MEVKLTRVTLNPVDAIEEAACNCYDSEPSGGKIMRACYNSGHHSVLEFANFTFHITGVSRALLAQLTRHRHVGFAVRSQRYCNEDGFEYVIPPSIRNNSNPEAVGSYVYFMQQCEDAYEHLQSLGVPNEDARYVLPNACCTTLEFTCNGRELIHIMNERLCMRAQWEIRSLCTLMKREVEEHDEQCAEFAKLLKPKCATLGYCPEHACCGREVKKTVVFNGYNKYKEISEKFAQYEKFAEDVKSGLIGTDELAEDFWTLFCKD